jgi:hypothetical protein
MGDFTRPLTNKGDEDSTRRSQEKGSSPKLVDHESEETACDESPYLKQTIDQTLCLRGCVANAVQHEAEVV